MDLAALRRILQRIADQVHQYLRQTIAITDHQRVPARLMIR